MGDRGSRAGPGLGRVRDGREVDVCPGGGWVPPNQVGTVISALFMQKELFKY